MDITQATKDRALEIAVRLAEKEEAQAVIDRQNEEAKRADIEYAKQLYESLQEAGHSEKVIEQTLLKMGIDYGIVEFLMLKTMEYPHHNIMGQGQQMQEGSMAGAGIGDSKRGPIVPEAPPPVEEAPPPAEESDAEPQAVFTTPPEESLPIEEPPPETEDA